MNCEENPKDLDTVWKLATRFTFPATGLFFSLFFDFSPLFCG
jgi:hypothetical protein